MKVRGLLFMDHRSGNAASRDRLGDVGVSRLLTHRDDDKTHETTTQWQTIATITSTVARSFVHRQSSLWSNKHSQTQAYNTASLSAAQLCMPHRGDATPYIHTKTTV